jgi:hypothetical protein
MALRNLDKQMAAERQQGEDEVREKHPDVLEIIPSFSEGALILDCHLAESDKLGQGTNGWIKYIWREDY